MRKYRIGISFRDFSVGGIQRVVASLVPLFQKEGWEVVLLTRNDASKDAIATFGNARRYVIGSHDGGERQRRMAKCIQDEHLDVVILHEYYLPCLEADILAVRSTGAKAIVHYHNVFSNLFVKAPTRLDIRAHYRMVGKADFVIALSRTDKRFFDLMGMRARYIPNPVRDRPDGVPFAPGGGMTILWAGRFSEDVKRPLEMLKIFSKVRGILPAARLIMLGDGDLKTVSELRRYLRESNIPEGSVHMPGFVPDCWDYLHDASVFVSTSRVEGFPCMFAEAMAAGVPIVSYALDYIELFRGEQLSYLRAEQGDVDGAAAHIIRILQDKGLAEKIRTVARKRFEFFADYDLIAAYRNLFAEVFEGENSSKPAEEESALVLQTLVSHACCCHESNGRTGSRQVKGLLGRVIKCWHDEGPLYTLKRMLALGRRHD